MKSLDLRAFRCPVPAMKTRRALKEVAPGEDVSVLVHGKDAIADIRALARTGGHTIVSETRNGEEMTFVIKRAP